MSEQNAIFGQLLRYGITGAGLALVFAVVYEAVLKIAGAPQVANSFAFVAATALGYIVHSQWSFRGQASRDEWRASTLNSSP